MSLVDLNNKTILVTGGCGFIGSNFIEYINSHYKNMVIVNVDKHGIGHRTLKGILPFSENNNKYLEEKSNITSMDITNHYWSVMTQYK